MIQKIFRMATPDIKFVLSTLVESRGGEGNAGDNHPGAQSPMKPVSLKYSGT